MSDVDIVRDALPRCPDHGKQNWAEGGCPGCVAAGSALAALDRLEAERDTLRDELVRLQSLSKDCSSRRPSRLHAAEARVAALEAAANARLAHGHNDTCQATFTDHPCNCGHNELCAALVVEGS